MPLVAVVLIVALALEVRLATWRDLRQEARLAVLMPLFFWTTDVGDARLVRPTEGGELPRKRVGRMLVLPCLCKMALILAVRSSASRAVSW